MMRPVYIRSVCALPVGAPEPDYRPFIPMMEARRMTPLMKRAVWTATKALKTAGLTVPDAILCGTQWGCLVNTEHFFKALHGLEERAPSPTHFMQSTHNTLASMLAIRLRCHGYNATYSHSAVSFESALLDAFLQIGAGAIDNALVGAYEEMPPLFGDVFGEQADTAAAFVLSASPAGALAQLEEVRLQRANGPADAAKVMAYALADALPCSGSLTLHNPGDGRSQSWISLCGN